MHGKTIILFKKRYVRGRVPSKPTEHVPSQNEKRGSGDSVRERGPSRPTEHVPSQNETEEGLATNTNRQLTYTTTNNFELNSLRKVSILSAQASGRQSPGAAKTEKISIFN